MSDPERGQGSARDRSAGGRLDSWKEIAAYLRRDERTARRWAEAAGLPVRRAPGKGRRPVFAFKQEIDDWLGRRLDAGEPLTAETIPPGSSPGTSRPRPRKPALLVAAAVVTVLAAALAAGYYLLPRRPRRAGAARLSPVQVHSLAVLPLANLSGDQGQDYVAEALTDELITNLAQIPHLRVISRTSVLNYERRRVSLAQIGRELQVDAVLEGSVARSGRQLRLNAQLIYIPGDRHLWARKFEGNTGNLVTLEDQLAAAATVSIEAVIAPGTAPAKPAPDLASATAYDAYLHGLYWLDRRDESALPRARAAFLQATRQAPDFAPGYAGLAQAEALLADYQLADPRVAFPRAQVAAERALALDGRLAGAHAVLAFVLWRYRWDRRAAAPEFARAIALNPNNATTHEWHGMYLAAGGQTAAAAQEFRAAERLDPLSRIAHVNRGIPAYYAGHLDIAIRRYRRALALTPDFGPGHIKLWLAYACAGDGPRARTELETVQRLYAGRDAARRTQVLEGGYQDAGLRGMLRAYLALRRQDARHGYVSPYSLAMLAALAGDRDQAFRFLARAVRDRDSWLVYARADPALATLRSDPRWPALLRRIGLAAT